MTLSANPNQAAAPLPGPGEASALEKRVRNALTQRHHAGSAPILLMAHLVLGYPSLDENRRVIDAMVANGVDLIELQIPFSEPIADGPVIAMANQAALDRGFRVAEGLGFLGEVVRQHPIPFLLMTYFNILHAHGVEAFIRETKVLGGDGLIVPDLPLEEAGPARTLCQDVGVDWIQLMTPTTPEARLAAIGAAARGFCYCVARKGVTGRQTEFDNTIDGFLDRCRSVTGVPLALGFGVKSAKDVQNLVGKADIAVVGTAAMEVHRTGGVFAVGRFFADLRT
ncbi:MAG: tryptophan synthase subunit alpha [Magnetococcus sp. DMHC-1]|nr:tryptophan synthase subunit alpha [Magnetococcales bacterium]